MAGLHVEVIGQGEPLVMLHGWGMHGGIWRDTSAQLAEHFQVHCVDLPGHGASAPVAAFKLGSVVGHLAAQFDQSITVCGWSLGGQIALHWAMREPEQIKRLALVTTTPCFIERDDWPFGMPQDTLLQFADDLEKNHSTTLRRFLGLQVRGSERERELLSNFRGSLFSRGEPDLDSLRGGLAILRESDLRSVLPQIMQPALVIAGERDKLSPAEASRFLARTLPNARLLEIKGAAHAPFMSHREEFFGRVMEFLNEKPA
ncbi:MAG: pimeloyl-ACP methyl ester esterase BioH [Pseudomonadota bacterium]